MDQIKDVPSFACVLGKGTDSIERVGIQMENISSYCDWESYCVIKDYLQEETGISKRQSEHHFKELNSQIKRVSHLVIDQAFTKISLGTRVHFTKITGKEVKQSLHRISFEKTLGEIRYTNEETADSIATLRRPTTIIQTIPLTLFDKIHPGVPQNVDRNNIVENMISIHKDIVEDYSFTLQRNTSFRPEPGTAPIQFDKLVISFSKESDYAFWYDCLQIRIKSIISLSSIDLSAYSRFQIYAILAINNGMSKIEKTLMGFQPPIPPLPPGPEHYKIEDKTKYKLKRASIQRRMSTWIEDIDDGDDFDLDIDSIVDAKLIELNNQPSSVIKTREHHSETISISDSTDIDAFRESIRSRSQSVQQTQKPDLQRTFSWNVKPKNTTNSPRGREGRRTFLGNTTDN